jgi:hypothetical protein
MAEIGYCPITKHWYKREILVNHLFWRISCGRKCCNAKKIGKTLRYNLDEGALIFPGHGQWKDFPADMQPNTETIENKRENKLTDPCTCGGPGRESYLIFSGTKFTVCTMCRKEK